MPRCNLDYNFMKKRKLGLKMSRPNFEFSKSHMNFGPKVAIFYQFMHYKCHTCVEFFEMLILGAMKNSFWPQFFRLGKVDFPLKLGFYQYSYIIISFSSTQRSKTIFYIIFVAYDIIFSTKSEKDILTFVIFFSQFWTHTKNICT